MFFLTKCLDSFFFKINFPIWRYFLRVFHVSDNALHVWKYTIRQNRQQTLVMLSTNSSPSLVCSRLRTESPIDKWRPTCPTLTSWFASFACAYSCVWCACMCMNMSVRMTLAAFPSHFPSCILSQNLLLVPRAHQVRLVQRASLYRGSPMFVPCAWITSGPITTMNNHPISPYWGLNL